MRRLYRSLLVLYPAPYRCEFADEMTYVFLQAEADTSSHSMRRRGAFYLREIVGLMFGALHTHICSLLGVNDWNPFRRFNMHPQFRFPRSTVFLMCVILAGVTFAIQKAQHVQATLTGMPVRNQTALPLLVTFAVVYAAAAAVWAILFALNRSGTHRLSSLMPAEPTPKPRVRAS